MFWNRILKKYGIAGGAIVLAALLLVGATGLFTISSCDMRPSSMGYPYRIFVFADSSVWKQVRRPIRDKFEGEVLTPRSEKKFRITYVPLNKLSAFKERMNLFFIGLLNEKGQVNDYLKQVLPENFKQGVREDRYFYVYQDNPFAREQIGLFMLAKDLKTFKYNFKRLQDQIYQNFLTKYYARLEKDMFDQGEQKKLEKYIADHYDFSIRVQHDYFIAIQDVPNNYLWLRRFDPDRWVSVCKIKGDSSMMHFDQLADIRDKYTKKYYQGDYVIREASYLKLAELNGQKTYKMVGVWRNDSIMVGGPFRTYVIDHPADSSLYFVDIAVMGPRYKKKPYLDQLEVIAHTFRILDGKADKKKTAN